MKKTDFTSGVVIIALIIFSSIDCFSQDWPQWRGIGRDGKVTGFKAPVSWPKELALVWKTGAGLGDATPVLVGKKLYVLARKGSEEVILCLDASSGKEIWQYKYNAMAVTGPSASQHSGPRSTPAVADGKIVTFGVSGILSCLDASSGKLIWRKENPTNATPQFFTGMSPLIAEKLCIAHVGAKDAGSVIAFDLNTGNEKWKWDGDGPAYASPAIMVIDGKKHIIVQTEKNLISLNLTDGKLVWQVPTPLQQRFYNCVSPYIDGQNIYYSGQGSGMKAIKVERSGDGYVTKELWSNPEVGAKWNTPVLKDGFLFGITDGRKIYCLDAKTGKTAWIDNTNNSDFGATVDCGTVIFALPSTGNLIVFKPSPKEYSEVARYKVAETAVFAHPVIAGNIIYIKDNDSLMQYKL
jgi:outer membrane protein assembly factor BamB